MIFTSPPHVTKSHTFIDPPPWAAPKARHALLCINKTLVIKY